MFAGLVLAGCQTTAGQAGATADAGATQPGHEAALSESRAAAAMGDYAGALEILVEILPQTADPAIAGQATRLAAVLEDWATASRAAERWAELDPGSFEALQARALAALRMGEYQRSVAILVAALNAEPPTLQWRQAVRVAGSAEDAGRARTLLGELLNRTGQHDAGFEAVPGGCDAYVMKHIIHDWGDEACVILLRNCAGHLGPDGRVLVVEEILPEGHGFSPTLLLDLEMLVMNEGGRERTEGEFRDLFAAAGLQLQALHPTPGALRVLEARPA